MQKRPKPGFHLPVPSGIRKIFRQSGHDETMFKMQQDVAEVANKGPNHAARSASKPERPWQIMLAVPPKALSP